MTPERIAGIAAKIVEDCGGIAQPFTLATVERAIRQAVNEALEEAAKECMEHAERVPEQYEALGLNDAAGIISELKLPEEP